MTTLQAQEAALQAELQARSDEYQAASAAGREEEARAANQAALAARRELDALRASSAYTQRTELEAYIADVQETIRGQERTGNRDASYSRNVERVRLARQALAQAERGEWNPETEWDDAVLRTRMMDPQKTGAEARRSASRTFKGPEARAERAQVVEEARDRAAAKAAADAPAAAPDYWEVADAQGGVWRSSNPEFLEEKTGVDPRKVTPGTVVLREAGTNKVYYSRVEQVRGESWVLGVGKPTQKPVQAVNVTERREPPTAEKMAEKSVMGPSRATQEAPPPLPGAGNTGSNVSALPPGITGFRPIDEAPPPERMVTAAEPPSTSKRASSMAREEWQRGDPFIAASVFTFGAVAGAAEFGGEFIKDPVGTSGEILASPALIAYDVATTGGKGTVQGIAANPAKFTGELAVLWAAGKVIPRVVSAEQAALRSYFDTRKFEGQLITREAAVQGYPRDPAAQIVARPMTGVQERFASVSERGTQATIAERRVAYDDPVMVTPKDLERLPSRYRADTTRRVSREVTPASGAEAPNIGAPARGAEASRIRTESSRLLTPEEVMRLSDERVVDVRESGLGPDVRGRATGESITVFKPAEKPPASAEYTSRGGRDATLRLTEDGRRIEYRPSLDYWEELLKVEQGGDLTVKRSYATGEVTTEGALTPSPGSGLILPGGGRPLVIDKVQYTPKPTGKGGGAAASFARVVEVEKPGPDGTVMVEQVLIKEKPVAPEAAKAETTSVEKSKAESMLKPEQKSTTGGKEAYSVNQVKKFYNRPRNLQDVYGRQRSRIDAATAARFSPASASAIATASALDAGQVAGQDAAQATGVTTAADSTLAQSTATAQDSRLTIDQSLRSRTVTTPTPGTPFPRTPPRRPPPEEPRLPRTRAPTDDSRPSSQRFSVEVRRRGRWERVAGGLDLQDAVKISEKAVLGSAAASFRLQENGGKRARFGDVKSFLKPGFFRASKREPGVIVQRRGKRLSSPGEKAEIRPRNLWRKQKGKSRSPFAR